MRFNPRIIPGDEPPTDEVGELALPDDLLLLADQLRDDAAHLARCHPAESFDTASCDTASFDTASFETVQSAAAVMRKAEVKAGKPKRRWVVVGSTLASILALAAFSAAYFVRQANEQPRETASMGSGSPKAIASAAQRGASPVADKAAANSQMPPAASPHETSKPVAAKAASAGREDRSDALSPILFLQEVSAPELEGWVDLLERQGDVEQTDLSI